jgi:hypothetical protein
MILLLILILSLGLAAYTAKKGLYEGWTVLFAVIISIYLGIKLSGTLTELLSLGDSDTAKTLTMLFTGLISFGVLYGLAFIIFLSQFEVSFPKIVDLSGGGITGFLASLLALSFIVFAISSSPIGQKKLFKSMGLDANKVRSSNLTGHMMWWSNRVDAIVGDGEIERQVASMFDRASRKKEKREVKPEQVETVKESVVEEIKPSDLGPPPELAFEDI